MKIDCIKKTVFILIICFSWSLFAKEQYVQISFSRVKTPRIESKGHTTNILLPRNLKKSIQQNYPGYRLPNNNDYQGDWVEFYKAGEAPFITLGDFNGDGLVDYALLLISGEKFGLFVFLTQSNGVFSSYRLDEDSINTHLTGMGIDKVSPGHYKTACGKDYGRPCCETDEMPEIFIDNEAINYFAYESANSYFYWDITTQTFKQIWISD